MPESVGLSISFIVSISYKVRYDIVYTFFKSMIRSNSTIAVNKKESIEIIYLLQFYRCLLYEAPNRCGPSSPGVREASSLTLNPVGVQHCMQWMSRVARAQ